MSRLGLIVITALCCALIGNTGLRAQDATPVANLGEAVDPAECRIAPRTAEELFALWSDVDEEDTGLTAAPVPLGQPADAEIVAAITATVREWYACANARDFGRVVAFMSDRLVDSLFSAEDGLTLEFVRSHVGPPTEPKPREEWQRLVAVTDVSVMEDGRVAAFLIEDSPARPPDGPTTELLIFVEERGRWVVDEILEFSEDEASSTPESPASPIAGTTLPGVRGRTYRSPTFGYSLAWDANWTVEFSTTADGQDQLRLWLGSANATFHGLPAGADSTLPADPAACLEAIVNRVAAGDRIDNLVPAPANLSPIGDGPNTAAGVYVGDVTGQSGNTGTIVLFLSCRSLGPDAVLFTTYAVELTRATEMEPLFRALDASVVLPDDSNPGGEPGRDATPTS